MAAAHGTGECPHCRRRIALRDDRTTRPHSRPNQGRCTGSRQPIVAGTYRDPESVSAASPTGPHTHGTVHRRDPRTTR